MFGLFKSSKKKQSEETAIAVASSNDEISAKKLRLHEDLNGLVWIGDGPYKNYSQKPISTNGIHVGPFIISFSLYDQEEPSLIYTSLKISEPSNIHEVERPSYYPNYRDLSPEQKYVYLKLLTNPYDSSINIGFVFILYYGLERHLLNGNFEQAFRTILKLRDVHTNASFQSYSASALILASMMHERGDLMLEFIDSLDKEHELKFSDNLFLLCAYSFDTPLSPNDIMRMAKSFDFKNMNYIKKHPEIFADKLRAKLLEKVGTDGVLLKNFLPETEIQKVKSAKGQLFANMSMLDVNIDVPQLVKNTLLRKEMNSLLQGAHDDVKKLLADARKAGTLIPENKPVREQKKLIFDQELETSLLQDLDAQSNDLVRRHFTYIYLQDFYYKYRTLGDQYIEKCKEYCLMDIASLEEMRGAFVQQEIARVEKLKSAYGPEETEKRIAEIKENGFIGVIPAFSRLAIIYEKDGNISEAIKISEMAIEMGESKEQFQNRINRLKKKQQK